MRDYLRSNDIGFATIGTFLYGLAQQAAGYGMAVFGVEDAKGVPWWVFAVVGVVTWLQMWKGRYDQAVADKTAPDVILESDIPEDVLEAVLPAPEIGVINP